jgi:hypothetical protein
MIKKNIEKKKTQLVLIKLENRFNNKKTLRRKQED